MLGKLIGWGVVLAALYVALWWWARRAAYYPMRTGWWDLQRTLGAADVWLAARDGVKLHAWWIAAPGSRLATLFLHGNAGNVTHRAPALAEIAAAGSSVLIVDYRGYGKSEGSPDEAGVYRDAEAGYEHLVGAGYPPARIILHGESLGSAVAIDLAARRPCAALVLEAPFSSGSAMAGRVLPVLGPLIFRGFDSLSKIGRVRAPSLFLHGDRDEVVPIALGRALFQAANEPKEFWELRGAGHNNLAEVAGPAYRERLRRFYQSVAPDGRPAE